MRGYAEERLLFKHNKRVQLEVSGTEILTGYEEIKLLQLEWLNPVAGCQEIAVSSTFAATLPNFEIIITLDRRLD